MTNIFTTSPPSTQPAAFPGWPVFEADEVHAVTDVLMSGKVNYWTGSEAREFEREYAEYLGVRHAIALHNGTLALELALYAFGIGEGDEVITTSRTFIASASAAVMRGCVPVIADVDPGSQNMTAETIRPLITPRTRAIIAVHLAGWPCDMDPIMKLAREHDLVVIEDCAQAHGAYYKGRPVGSIGHAGAFSFCQDKIITTGGEGGLLALNDTEVWKKAWAYKDHGKSYDAVYEREHPRAFAGCTSRLAPTGGCWRSRQPLDGCNCGSCPSGSCGAVRTPLS
ncbi:DegT/DnrJ/EryC1/StrS family aminotransferase [Deinococcus malanensis]|uniref:DegT/DnrJ/EryC1/StrS family aminotransferase n=1 Tax=Deinococcus malanensis TaxID=1706855 RepID=UPI003641AF7E